MKNNLKEFKTLIKKYRSISEEDILKLKEGYMCEAAAALTGFGNPATCMLCKGADFKEGSDCPKCMWAIITNEQCNAKSNLLTYKGIAYAETPKDLELAFRTRADYMEATLKLLPNQRNL